MGGSMSNSRWTIKNKLNWRSLVSWYHVKAPPPCLCFIVFIFILFYLPIFLSLYPTDLAYIQLSVFMGFPGIWISVSLNLYLMPFLRLFYLCLLVLPYSVVSLGFILLYIIPFYYYPLETFVFWREQKGCGSRWKGKGRTRGNRGERIIWDKVIFNKRGKSLPYITLPKLCG